MCVCVCVCVCVLNMTKTVCYVACSLNVSCFFSVFPPFICFSVFSSFTSILLCLRFSVLPPFDCPFLPSFLPSFPLGSLTVPLYIPLSVFFSSSFYSQDNNQLEKRKSQSPCKNSGQKKSGIPKDLTGLK